MSEREPRSNYENPEVSPEQGAYLVGAATHDDLEKLKAAIPPPEDDLEQYEFLLEQQINFPELTLGVLACYASRSWRPASSLPCN